MKQPSILFVFSASLLTTGIVGGTLSYANQAHCADRLANFSHGTVSRKWAVRKMGKTFVSGTSSLERLIFSKLHTIIFGVKT